MENIQLIPFERLRVSKYNVRTHVDWDEVEKLYNSIKVNGLLQPLVVIPSEDFYDIIIGKRRFFALKLLRERDPERFEELFGGGVPCVVKRGISPREAVIMSLTENIQRQSIDREELSQAIVRLRREFGLSPEEISKSVQVDMSAIEEALSIYEAVTRGLEISRPGRPPKKKESKRIPRLATVKASVLTKKFERKGVLEPEKRREFKEKFIEKAAGLSGKEIELFAKELERAAEEKGRVDDEVIETVAKKIREKDTVERVVLFEKQVVEIVETIARFKGKKFDAVVNELLRSELRRRGYNV